MHVQLPDRKWITLCEAVTAFVYGESRDASSVPFYPMASDALLEQLHDAAQAGAIKFRALRRGNNNYQEINPGYFSTTRHFGWKQNQISCWVPCDGGEYEQELAVEWYDVNLERDQYASLLGDMGVSVQSNSVSDALDKSKIYKTGLQGRPTAKQLALPIVIAHPSPPADQAGAAACAARAARMAERALRPARRPVATMEQISA